MPSSRHSRQSKENVEIMIYALSDNSIDLLAMRGLSICSKEELYNYLTDNDYRIRTFAAQTIQGLGVR